MENSTNAVYDKIFILSKKYCYYCQCCNYCRETITMNHTFNYNDISNMSNMSNVSNINDINNNDIWNRMIEVIMNRDNNNYDYNEINVGIYIYYTQTEKYLCEFNLPIEEQKIYLFNEFIKKYL